MTPRFLFVSLVARLRPVLVAFLIGMALLSISRLGLSLWHAGAVTAVHGWTEVLLHGLRVDVATMCMLTGIPAILTMLLPREGRVGRLWGVILRVWLTLVICVLVFMELATPDFMTEYGLRPNRLFVEYLIYPKEVASTLLKGHVTSLLVGLAGVGLAGWAMWKVCGRQLMRRA